MASVPDRVCLNHTDRPAVSRCETCFKPLCDDCILLVEGTHFCSQECSEKYGESSERISDFNRRRTKDRRGRLVRRIITLLVLLGILAAGYWYATNNPGEVRRLRRAIDDLIGNVTGG